MDRAKSVTHLRQSNLSICVDTQMVLFMFVCGVCTNQVKTTSNYLFLHNSIGIEKRELNLLFSLTCWSHPFLKNNMFYTENLTWKIDLVYFYHSFHSWKKHHKSTFLVKIVYIINYIFQKIKSKHKVQTYNRLIADL